MAKDVGSRDRSRIMSSIPLEEWVLSIVLRASTCAYVSPLLEVVVDNVANAINDTSRRERR